MLTGPLFYKGKWYFPESKNLPTAVIRHAKKHDVWEDKKSLGAAPENKATSEE